MVTRLELLGHTLAAARAEYDRVVVRDGERRADEASVEGDELTAAGDDALKAPETAEFGEFMGFVHAHSVADLNDD